MVQVFGIPNCGTCKKAMQWLQTEGIPYEFVNTREQPPTSDQVSQWVSSLGSRPLRNTSGQSYRALGDQRNTMTDSEWIDAFVQDPMLLKRPLFVKEGKAIAVGFRQSPDQLRESFS